MDRLSFNKLSDQVFDEIQKAEIKHPIFPDNLVYKASLLSEESGEASREANFIVMENKESKEAFKKEVTQVACICFRILESMEE